MTIGADSRPREIAFEVCSALTECGVTAVLSGGGAASIWAPTAVHSDDLDFVPTFRADGHRGAEALARSGFAMKHDDDVHPESPYWLESPPGPLSIGDEPIEQGATFVEDGRVLHVLSATDSCRDRLAAFYFFNDRSALAVAWHVASANLDKLDVLKIREWRLREGMKGRFEGFELGSRSGAWDGSSSDSGV